MVSVQCFSTRSMAPRTLPLVVQQARGEGKYYVGLHDTRHLPFVMSVLLLIE